MPRKIASTLLVAGIVLLVIMWFASGPPPASITRVAPEAASEPRPEPPQELQPQQREAAQSSDAEPVEGPAQPREAVPNAALSMMLPHQNPPGVLEVVVMFDHAPKAGASVRLLRGSVVRNESGEVIEEAAAILTDARGVATFEGLDGDRILVVEACVDTDLIATVQTLLHKAEPTWRIVMQLGRGGVAGKVFALDGAPVAGVRIAVESRPHDGHGWSRAVRSDEDGRYSIGGIAPGSANVFAEESAAGAERRVDVELRDGEWKRVNFGSPQRALHWSGRVRLGSGANVDGFEAFEVREAARGEQIRVACSSTGEFAAYLPRGEYIASAWTGAGNTELGRISLMDRDVVQDLVLPGIQVRGRIEYSGTWHDKAQPASSVQVWFGRVGGSRSMARRNADDRYVIQCLERGDYTLTTWPCPLLGAGEPGIRVQLDGATDDLIVDLTITDP